MTTTVHTVNLDDVVRWAREAVAQKGAEYVYPRAYQAACYYTEPGNTGWGCLVGHMLPHFGIKPEDFVTDEMRRESASQLSELFPEAFGGVTDAALEFLVEIQSRQDLGVPWGDAVDIGERVVRERASQGVYDTV